ncbi:MAG TPA: ferredoxin family protein [Coprothermobacter proteolyticus]|jgi:2-oxoglutarate ferredoxin oxidoreductase subunit delta|uniref:Conserved domain protein n=1 Tax=Coprothermobacter proteolyticus (strain ATCC 35245 / DSM 5265 / OCM 4 / BT) TaxID=309798 RepID=B5Y8N4_COPPD|nr:ferredoxin family protein [Coprothermobacter proteolyticus]MBK6585617.1 4Fe-4S binding protein [Coprothermobacter sp.]ACI17760.1 tungsten formylmethanofuran dehydrogenase [Coprothermobacter proteolyticus DSM 5265]MBP8983226.1 4Fe-4S binding protein [Coprothermobacter sp.]NLT83824.1 4Fe-4S binding protein [Coprothermobacter proteolyticus]HAR40154.1 4Fe-4S dicluster domain-containing protein [Coprothermobacter sp.]
MSEQALKVVIDEELCKQCELCVAICPMHVLRISSKINSKGFHPAELFDNDKCISCGFCAMTCPERAIAVYKPEVEKA